MGGPVVKQHASPEMVEHVFAQGERKYGVLGVSLQELSVWIEAIERGDNGRENAVTTELNADLYLVAALAKGTTEAWAIWRDRIERPTVRYIMNLPEGYRFADDILTDLIGDLFAGKFRRYRGESSLRTWVTAVARNRLTDMLRSEDRRARLEVWFVCSPEGRTRVTNEDQIQRMIEARDRESALEAVMNRLNCLPPDERRLMTEYYFDGTKMRVLAKKYGIDRTHVGKRLKGIIQKIRLTFPDVQNCGASSAARKGGDNMPRLEVPIRDPGTVSGDHFGVGQEQLQPPTPSPTKEVDVTPSVYPNPWKNPAHQDQVWEVFRRHLGPRGVVEKSLDELKGEFPEEYRNSDFRWLGQTIVSELIGAGRLLRNTYPKGYVVLDGAGNRLGEITVKKYSRRPRVAKPPKVPEVAPEQAPVSEPAPLPVVVAVTPPAQSTLVVPVRLEIPDDTWSDDRVIAARTLIPPAIVAEFDTLAHMEAALVGQLDEVRSEMDKLCVRLGVTVAAVLKTGHYRALLSENKVRDLIKKVRQFRPAFCDEVLPEAKGNGKNGDKP